MIIPADLNLAKLGQPPSTRSHLINITGLLQRLLQTGVWVMTIQSRRLDLAYDRGSPFTLRSDPVKASSCLQ